MRKERQMTGATVLCRFFIPVLAALLAAVFVTVANAGEFEKDGLALRGHDVVALDLAAREMGLRADDTSA
jgi:hypothetical protein